MEYKVKLQVIKHESGDFRIYGGILNGNQSCSVKTNGFELPLGIEIRIEGTEGIYNNQPSITAKYEIISISDREAAFNLLIRCKGISEKIADLILDTIPNADLNIFFGENIPKIKGIGPVKLQNIKDQLKEIMSNENLRKLMAMVGIKLSSTKCHKIIETLKQENISFENFIKDPYYFLIETIGLTFKKADDIALNSFRCDKELDSRLMYLTEKIVNDITTYGDTYCEKTKLDSTLQENNISLDKINEFLASKDQRLRIHTEKAEIDSEKKEIVQTKEMYLSESYIPYKIRMLQHNDDIQDEFDLPYNEIFIDQYEKESGIRLHPKQAEAVLMTMDSNVHMICGGAGTGKTTIIKAVISQFEANDYNVVLLAPTGKAARRMTEATNRKAYTCHKFFGAMDSMSITGNIPEWHLSCKTILIIDEFSMVDSILFYNVLKVLPKNYVRLLMVGDRGQLASVGAGSVMSDIIDSNTVRITELEAIFRQKHGSKIIDYSTMVRNNEIFPTSQEKGFFTKIIDTINRANNWILGSFLKKYSEMDKIDCFEEFQICSATRARCNSINKMIQDSLKNTRIKIKNTDTGFCLGEKIMNTKNDYEREVFNGEFGIIEAVEYKNYKSDDYILAKTNEKLLEMNSKDTSNYSISLIINYYELGKRCDYDLDFSDLENLQLAYCCTIHKLQGSQFKIVMCDLIGANNFTDSRLLYTAITRASEYFIIIFSSNQSKINVCLNKNSSKRKTRLLDKLKRAE